MRTQQRLLEVIDSLGEAVDPIAFIALNLSRDVIDGAYSREDALSLMLAGIVRKHPSPHIREIAAEALHYMESA